MKRAEYATLNMPHSVAIRGSVNQSPLVLPATIVSAKNISFDRKPLSSGTPAIAAAATIATVAVIGMARRKPLNRFISRVPVSWSTMPAAMKSEALKVAWFIMWNTAATRASWLFMPSSSVIKPRWLIVEYAEHAFHVALEERGRRAEQERRSARGADNPEPQISAGQRRPEPSEQEYAGLHHRRRVQVRGYGRRRRHRVRQPEMKRKLGALRERADHDENQHRPRTKRWARIASPAPSTRSRS